jgi:hypothetical protein
VKQLLKRQIDLLSNVLLRMASFSEQIPIIAGRVGALTVRAGGTIRPQQGRRYEAEDQKEPQGPIVH